MATKLQDEDLSGMGTTAFTIATQEQRELGTKMLNTRFLMRARSTLARAKTKAKKLLWFDGRVGIK